MTTMADIDREIAARHLLTHPFYEAWTKGTLPRAALLDYARQYFAFEVRLPRFLTALHSRADERPVRAALLANAWDEEHGEQNHAELWLRFAEALGLSRDEVVGAEPTEATRSLVECYRAAAEEGPVEAGVASLYAYESQLPAVAEAKIQGLVQHFGFQAPDKKRGLAFFETHRTLDVEHAAAERAIVQAGMAKGQGESAVATAKAALEAWWAFLSAFVPNDCAHAAA